MSTGANQPEDSRWLQGPSAPNQIEIRVAVGDDAVVTPELQETLDRLLSMTRPDEVVGYALGCPPVSCNLGGCMPFYEGPCRTLFVCGVSPETRR